MYDDYDSPVLDDDGNEVSPLDDDYSYYKSQNENENNPLSDDYIREEYRSEI